MTVKNLLETPKNVPGWDMAKFSRDMVRWAESDAVGATDIDVTVSLFKLPANAVVLGYTLQVATGFNGTTPTLAIGDSDDTLATISGTDITTTGYISGSVFKKYTAAQVFTATVSATDGTAGSATVGIMYKLQSDKTHVK